MLETVIVKDILTKCELKIFSSLN